MSNQTSERRRKYRVYPAPAESIRGRDLYSGYLQLSAAVLNQAVIDVMDSRDPGTQLESLYWLCCSQACDLMLQNLEIEQAGTDLLKKGKLQDEKLKGKLRWKKYKYDRKERHLRLKEKKELEKNAE